MKARSVANSTALSASTPDQLREWLPWVIKIRFVIISFVFAIDFSIRALVAYPSNPAAFKHFAIVIIFWYIIGLYFLIYNQLSRDYLLQAYLQIFCDIAVITAVLHATGDLESNYLSLYLVVIIFASMLLTRGRVYLVAAVSFVCMGGMLELAYLPAIFPELPVRYQGLHYLVTTSPLAVDLGTLQVKIGGSLFGFFAVAYLSSHLSDRLRQVGEELRHRDGQVASLRAKTENILESMRGGLASTDMAGLIGEVNSPGAALLGVTAEELRGKPIQEIFPDLAANGPNSLAAGAFPTRQEINYLHPRGGRRILGISASLLMVPGTGAVGLVYTFQDLTEEKRREAEYRTKDRMATLGRMAAGIAHEIRNPLASIAGSVRLLQSISRLDEDQTKLIEIVNHESERLNKLVSDFLLYCRDHRPEPQEVNVGSVIEETLVLLAHHPLMGPNIRVERQLPAGAPKVWADSDQLRQIFWNISDNALKAMPEGGQLTVRVEEAGAEMLRVTFRDTGIGFTEQQLEKAFEPFQPGFSGGTGLGLAIVYQLVQGLHGTIRVESKTGKGASFILELPRRPSAVGNLNPGRGQWLGS